MELSLQKWLVEITNALEAEAKMEVWQFGFLLSEADSDEKRLQNRFQTHREKLLTFLVYPDVPPTNNASGQAIRTSVIHRKVTNGFRSDWGAKAYADLPSVISPSKINFRRLTVRYERSAKVFTALVHKACDLMTLKRVLG